MRADLHTASAGTRSGAAAADILCLYYPQQILPALAAVVTDRQRRDVDVTTPLRAILLNQAADPRVHAARRDLVERLLGAFPWVRLWAPGPAEVQRELSSRRALSAKARFVRTGLGDLDVGAIFYPHDLTSDFLPVAVGRAFPAGRRVCFGDGLGMVYTRDYFERHLYGAATLHGALTMPATAARHGLARLRRAWMRRFDDRTADSYVLILPHDPTGGCLASADVTIVPYAGAREIAANLAARVRDEVLGSAAALFAGDRETPLLLLGSYSESRLCSERQEIDLYLDALRAHVPAGGRVVLKPHPAAGDAKMARLLAAIGTDYKAEVVSRDLAEVPVELLGALIEQRPVLSFSHASVALAYFGLGEVRHVLTDERIERFFPPFIRPWMVESNRQYVEQQRSAAEARRALRSIR